MKKISIIFCLISFACSQQAVKNETPESAKDLSVVELSEAQLKSAEIKTSILELKEISTMIKVNGKIDVPPQNLISVSVPLGGYLKSTKLLPGMHILKGEVIAVLEDQQYIQLQQEYLITKVKLQTAEFEYLRQKDLNESKASSDKVFQQAKSEFLSTKITLSALSEKLKLININPSNLTEENLSKNINLYAPFDGFVSKVNVNIGKYITPSDVIFELVNPNDIHLNLKVFEKDVTSLNVGQKLLAYTNNNPEKKYKCEILEISKDISNEGTAEVHSHFENYDKTLLPGMYMNAEVEIKAKESLAIDETAIVVFDSKKYVFVANNNNSFQMIEVTTGESENNFVSILNGNDLVNKKIVTQGAYVLLMALKNKSED